MAVGIGLFIAFIGFRNAGIVAPDPETTVTLENLRDPGALLPLFGLLLISVLMARGVRAALLIGIIPATWAGAATGLVQWNPAPYWLSEIPATFLKLDVPGALRLGLLEIVFLFLFVDVFDNIGTLVAVGKRARLFDDAGRIPRVNRILTCDAPATTAGSPCGTSTVVSYIESAAGVVAGSRSGVRAVVSGLLFAGAMFVAPMF